MKIGLIIAIEREIKSFLQSGIAIEELNERKIKYYKSVVKGNEVYAIKSGYGLIDAAAATQFLIAKHSVDTVINFGVTGALEKDLKVSDLFVVNKCLNYYYDVSPIDPVKKMQYEEFEDEFIPLDKELVEMVKKIDPNIKEAIDCSSDQFVNDLADKIERRKTGAIICDMEIAAIARVCYQNGVKCLSIKCISDTLDGDGGDFEKNVRSSADKAFEVILKILDEIK